MTSKFLAPCILIALLGCGSNNQSSGAGGAGGAAATTSTSTGTSTGTTTTNTSSASSGSGGGSATLCGDPESYMPSWAVNAVPDQEIYISPTGDDANDGSAAKPLKTTAAALQKFAPGVRLNFAAGTYACNIVLQGFAGTRAKPGIIRSSDGPKKAKFACAPNDAGIYISKGSGIIVDGIELSGGAGHAIQLDSGNPFDPNALSHDLVIHASYIHDPACAPIKIAQSAFIWVIGNEFSNPGLCGGGSQRQDVEFVAVDDTVVVGNDAHNSSLFNEVKGGARRALIALNHVHDGTNGILVGGDQTGYQFLVDKTVDFEASAVTVWGNTIALPGAGSEAFRVVACHDCLIANNTFYSDAATHVLRVLSSNFGNGTDTHNQNVRVINNIFAMGSKAGLYAIASNEMASVLSFSHNLWFAGDGSMQGVFSDIPFNGDPTSIYDIDPQLMAPLTNLAPKPGSPAIGAGMVLPEVPASAGGSCWSGPPDIGAY